MKRPAVLLPLILVLAGCAAADPEHDGATGGPARRLVGGSGFVGETFAGSVDPERALDPAKDFSKIVVAEHPEAPGPTGHLIRALHPKEPFGMKVVAFDPLARASEAAREDVWHSALDVWDDGKDFYAAVTQLAGTGGATIVDVKDPAKPRVVSQIYSGMANSDVQFTDDGKYVFIGSIAGAPQQLTEIRNVLRQTPVPFLYDAAASGVSVWDVTDKANPKFVLFREVGDFHNLFTVTINGTYYLLQTYSNNVYEFNPEGGGRLTPVSKTSTMIHDMTVGRHPLTGDWMLYTGKGRGTAVIGLNDPAHPLDLGVWAPESGPNAAKGWHDQEVSAQLVDGKALIVVGGETQAGSEPYGILDVSDPANPELVGSWEVPGHPRAPAQSVTFFSPHELDVWNGYFVSGNYHGGVWLVDIGSAERMVNPVTLGYFFGAEEPALRGAPQNVPAAWSPIHWGAYFDSRGYIYTADGGAGLYILAFEKTGTWTPSAPPGERVG